MRAPRPVDAAWLLRSQLSSGAGAEAGPLSFFLVLSWPSRPCLTSNSGIVPRACLCEVLRQHGEGHKPEHTEVAQNFLRSFEEDWASSSWEPFRNTRRELGGSPLLCRRKGHCILRIQNSVT